MKLLAVEIVGFGKWQQQKITFESGNQLLYGANEVGKSTLYQFIQAMLFGFPTKGKRKRDYAPKNGGSYGGRLWLAHPVFGEVQVERFKEKNKGQAIIYYQQQMGDEKTLQQMLHPLTKKLFQEVFTFQQEQLIALGLLLLKQRSLFLQAATAILRTRESDVAVPQPVTSPVAFLLIAVAVSLAVVLFRESFLLIVEKFVAALLSLEFALLVLDKPPTSD